jgi:hypothetical protein
VLSSEDEALRKQSSELSLRRVLMAQKTIEHCAHRDAYAKVQQDEKHRAFVEENLVQHRALCEAYGQAFKSLGEIGARLQMGEHAGMFEFTAFSELPIEASDLRFGADPLGPFVTLEACTNAESLLRAARVGTLRCIDWKPLIPPKAKK